jgi:phage replication-related protein YjqB (UPF0714/DUF867 family)
MLRDLLAHPLVSEEMRLGGPVGVMAIHGGVEAWTAEMARKLADATGSSLYLVNQAEDLAWHIPSIRYDPAHSPRLASFLGHVRTVVSLHGFGRDHLPRTVLVGGRNDALRHHVASGLRSGTRLRIVDDLEAIPRALRGRHPANPVNMPAEEGVQLELSGTARLLPHRDMVVAALTTAIATAL